MSDNGNTADVIPLKRVSTRAAAKASERKWGKQVLDLGFCIVPSLLLRAQRRLGLSNTQLALLMHLADYWWDAHRKPWPSKKALAERVGIGERQVQRQLAQLEAVGLIRREPRTKADGGKTTNMYDLSGLVQRLQELAPEFREVEEAAKASRRNVARPGIRRRTHKAE